MGETPWSISFHPNVSLIMPLNRIREYRKKAGLSLEELGARIGMTDGNLSKLERGSVGYTQATLESLAREFGVRPADLLTNADPPPGRVDTKLLKVILRETIERLGGKLRRSDPDALANLIAFTYDEACNTGTPSDEDKVRQMVETLARYEASKDEPSD